MDNPIFGGDAPLTYRIAPIRIAGPRATEMGALLSPCRSPSVDEDYDDGTDDDRGEPVDDDDINAKIAEFKDELRLKLCSFSL